MSIKRCATDKKVEYIDSVTFLNLEQDKIHKYEKYKSKKKKKKIEKDIT